MKNRLAGTGGLRITQALEDQPETSLVSDRDNMSIRSRRQQFSIQSCRCRGWRFARLAAEIAAVLSGWNRFGEVGS